MGSLATYSEGTLSEDFQVIVDVESPFAELLSSTAPDEEKRRFLSSINEKEQMINEKLASLDAQIEKRANNADGLDYSIAASAGVICGIIDSFVVGCFDYDKALKRIKSSDAGERVNSFVESKSESIRLKETIEKNVKNKIEKARLQGKELSSEDIQALREKITEGVNNKYLKFKNRDAAEGTTKALARAINKLEKHFELPLDNIYNGVKGTNSATHHLDDWAHHPTPLGLVAAILGTFFRIGILTDKNGRFHIRFKKQNPKEWLKVVSPLVISGIITWLLNLAKKENQEIVNSKLPKPFQNLILLLAQTPAVISVLGVINNWLGHLVSDMAGSHSTVAKGKPGQGIPGFFLASLKELSSIPPLNLTKLPKAINEMFQDDGLDMRGELAILEDIGSFLGKQAIPVIGGELVVRTFYFIRHLIEGIRLKGSLQALEASDWRKVIPFNNRTIARMMTVESCVFTAFDLADAAIRSTAKTGGPENPMFWKDLIFSVNFVGVGRCVIAVGNDVYMGVSKNTLIKERMAYKNQALQLHNSKVFFYQEGMWKSAINVTEGLEHLYARVEETVVFYNKSFSRLNEKWDSARSELENLRESDREFFDNTFALL